MSDDLIAKALAETNKELEAARATVRELANELADVADVIEPTLAAAAKRLRQARMTTLDEVRQVTTGLKEMRTTVLSKETQEALAQAERVIRVCRELADLRERGWLRVLGGGTDGT